MIIRAKGDLHSVVPTEIQLTSEEYASPDLPGIVHEMFEVFDDDGTPLEFTVEVND